jgi:glycosyltransferase involved in cell wall biosynthesis
VDTDLFNPARRSEELRQAIAPSAEKIVLYVGRLAPEKQLKVLLEAFPLVRKALGDQVVLALVGDGPWMSRLNKEPSEGVLLLGYRTGVPLAEAYACGDVFAFPSDTETFGNVVTEALASGLPVVAPWKGGVTDSVIPGRTGTLIPPRDSNAMAQALIHLLEDEEERQRLSDGARTHAESQTWDSIFDALFAGYEDAVEAVEAFA